MVFLACHNNFGGFSELKEFPFGESFQKNFDRIEKINSYGKMFLKKSIGELFK